MQLSGSPWSTPGIAGVQSFSNEARLPDASVSFFAFVRSSGAALCCAEPDINTIGVILGL